MNNESSDILDLSQGMTLLNLSAESGFYTDWKQAYHEDVEQAVLNPYPTDAIMSSVTRVISTLCAQFQLSHSIEFSAIDTLEQLLIKIAAAGEEGGGGGEADGRKNFLQQVPHYVVTVVNLVGKHFDAHTKLDRQLIQRMVLQGAAAFSDLQMMKLEFEILKSLNHKISHSLLLGAVERFAKDHILTLGIIRKDRVGTIGIKLLRVVYAEKYFIYNSLKPRLKSEDMFVRFKSNKLVLAAAIVLAILKLCGADREQVLSPIVKSLSNECFVEQLNIIFLRDAILSVFDNNV